MALRNRTACLHLAWHVHKTISMEKSMKWEISPLKCGSSEEISPRGFGEERNGTHRRALVLAELPAARARRLSDRNSNEVQRRGY